MNSSVILVVVLATSCLLCEAGLFSRKPVKKNPVDALSKILSKLTDDCDLAANVRVALEHNWKNEPEAAQASFMEAVKAFKSIRPDEPCHPDNVLSAGFLSKRGGITDVDFVIERDSERVAFVLGQLKNKAESQCFPKFEKNWNEDLERTSRLESKFPELVQLSKLISEYTEPYGSQTNFDILQLDAVIEMITNPTHHQLKGESVKRMLRAIHELKGSKDQLDSIPEAQAAQLIQDYLVKPCEQLNKQPEVNTFFGPMTAWGNFVALIDNIKQGHDGQSAVQPNFESIIWSARWAFCAVVLKRHDLDKLAEAVSKA